MITVVACLSMHYHLIEVPNLNERHGLYICLHFSTVQNVNACSVTRKMDQLIFNCGLDNIFLLSGGQDGKYLSFMLIISIFNINNHWV